MILSLPRRPACPRSGLLRSGLLRSAAVLALCALLAAPAPAQEVDEAPAAPIGDVGAYLAARNAEAHGDFRASADFFARAAEADPGNLMLLEALLFATLNLGEIEAAAAAADTIEAAGGVSQLVDFALLARSALAEDYGGFVKSVEDGRSVGPVFDRLALGWAEIGQGRMSEALAHFDAIAASRGFEAYGLYHKALAIAMAGDFEGADRILSVEAEGPLNLNRRGVEAHAQILSQLERNQDALALLDRAFGPAPEPVVDALRARLAAGEPVPFDSVTSARDGIAEVYFSLATLLMGEADPAFTLLNSRAAMALRPDHVEALLLSAGMLEQLNQYDLAVEIYAQIPSDHPAHYSAEIGRADALYAAGRVDAAIEALRALTRSHGDLLLVQASLADMLRREERWQEALTVYDTAIGMIDAAPERGHWTLYFTRGICHERLDQDDASEADMRRALELNPGQPQVLNYLGYSMLERGVNPEEALSLIEQAVAAQPDAGYIIDSLAWAYFVLGRYGEALAPMERASVLEPVDPVVTDHLGDVYWMNGRKREAEFQWHRALSFGPEEKDAARIRRKLEIGLDAVMAEEGPQAGNGSAQGN
ncbi:tetratricopeptide repeat protein [Pseudogemmobacter sonorensis]|uniref:tetratricopeptide repeat protein n=1 Tax=Pseudogemmobacter sonorensis TaxID=2989681 RepID=UPI003689099F